MSNILSIGESALFAAQAQLATTSHNIANAGTPGYTRQVVQQATAGAQNQGNGFIGQGTTVNSVTRVYDGFLTKQILTAQTSASAYAAYGSEISQVDNVVGDSSSGLSPALASFFNGMQDLTANHVERPDHQFLRNPNRLAECSDQRGTGCYRAAAQRFAGPARSDRREPEQDCESDYAAARRRRR
jgi:flagellar hook-associated protein 1 FlgK